MPDTLRPPTAARRWPRTRSGRRAFRASLAVVVGAGLGAVCHVVPEEAREVCQALAQLARLTVGLW